MSELNKKKQIEEMARIPESEMGMSGYSKFSWKLWEAGLCTMAKAEIADRIMRNMGYRKASEVAEEIFAELDKAGIFAYRYPIIAELKKKYTEGEG